MNTGQRSNYLRIVLFNVVAVVAIFEVLFALAFNFPQLTLILPPALRSIVVGHYDNAVTPVVHFQSGCGQHDDKLIYRLAPGICRFSTWQFDTNLSINSLGLRDDEFGASSGFEIVSVGDSYALGWGVEQNQTYAVKLEAELGVEVVNAGQASYGTARELLLGLQLVKPSTRHLILQISHNDRKENATFVANNYKLPSALLRPSYFKEVVKSYRNSRIYLPGRYAISFFITLFSEKDSLRTEGEPNVSELVDMLEHFGPQFPERLQLIVLYIPRVGSSDSGFAQELKAAAIESQVPFVRDLKFVELGDLNASRFSLDIHLRPEGHAFIAKALADVIREGP